MLDHQYPQIVLKGAAIPGFDDISVYEQHEGYAAWRKALQEYSPAQVIDIVKRSNLRGRGGAGFPAGVKWSFLTPNVYPRYLVCNADEGEPGTFKDRQIMEQVPHRLLEGIILSSYAIGCNQAFIYVRGEYTTAKRQLAKAIAQAQEKGYLGKNILGSGYDLEVIVHTGAGSYECGEETALLESLEGKRGQPRNKPPFPAAVGLYDKPTVINNVETLANVPAIVLNGPEWFAVIGTPKSTGTKVFSVSGHVNRPGNYELPLGTPFRVLIEAMAGGVRGGKGLKAFLPAGAAAPILPASAIDTPMDFEAVQAAGSMLGSGSIIVLDEETCIVWAAMKMARFFRHESCGKCTPCREGTYFGMKVLERIERGEGRPGDPDLLLAISDQMLGKCFCPLGDFATSPLLSTVKHFRDEYEAHIREGRCPFRR